MTEINGVENAQSPDPVAAAQADLDALTAHMEALSAADDDKARVRSYHAKMRARVEKAEQFLSRRHREIDMEVERRAAKIAKQKFEALKAEYREKHDVWRDAKRLFDDVVERGDKTIAAIKEFVSEHGSQGALSEDEWKLLRKVAHPDNSASSDNRAEAFRLLTDRKDALTAGDLGRQNRILLQLGRKIKTNRDDWIKLRLEMIEKIVEAWL